ncbi:hypothetical protein HII31_07214 [Pseudocercospora fuligena]|uniref:Uncharacterized protein n=1 Tax=Pseudocercospora fuligena TaxID=685502 RepID=A0A8H6VII5_9PEZI|nr:hypothetical protein HII31_07214 [Pseudocercospora fuligena]
MELIGYFDIRKWVRDQGTKKQSTTSSLESHAGQKRRHSGDALMAKDASKDALAEDVVMNDRPTSAPSACNQRSSEEPPSSLPVASSKQQPSTAELQALNDRLRTEIQELTAKCKTSIQRTVNQGKLIRRLKAEASEASYLAHSQEQRIAGLVADLNGRDQRIRELQAKLIGLEDQNEQLGDTVRLLQRSTFDTLDSARWMPMTDSTVNAEFSKIRTAINKLAKKYAATSFHFEKCNNEELLEIRKELSSFVKFDSDGIAVLEELNKISHGPRLCLTALLSHAAHTYLIKDPFFLWSSDESLSKVYTAVEDYDVRGANIWRSDTLRLLNPRHISNTAAGDVQDKHIEAGIRDAAERCFQALGKNTLAVLISGTNPDADRQFHEEIVQVFFQTGQFALKLWCERPITGCLALKQFADGTTFEASSEILQLHNLHKHVDDPEDERYHSFDGRRPKIYCHPAVNRWGTHEGKGYEHHRILEKAVVWLDTPEG